MWDVKAYCSQEGKCGFGTLLDNMQTNAFSLITQVSQTVAIFKQQSWSEMDEESRAYALN